MHYVVDLDIHDHLVNEFLYLSIWSETAYMSLDFLTSLRCSPEIGLNDLPSPLCKTRSGALFPCKSMGRASSSSIVFCVRSLLNPSQLRIWIYTLLRDKSCFGPDLLAPQTGKSQNEIVIGLHQSGFTNAVCKAESTST